MRRLRLGPALLLSPALILLASPDAGADIAPPPGYVERCTVAHECRRGEEGIVCRGSFQAPDGCSEKLEPDGWSLRCKTRGASVWNEVFCRPKPKEEPKPKKAPAREPAAEPEKAPTPAPAPAPAPEAAPEG